MALLVGCGNSIAAPTKKESDKRQGTARSYTVAGLATGMNSNQIAAAATQAGYRKTDADSGPDWALEQRIASTGNQFQFGVPMKGLRTETFTKGGEQVSVHYIAMPNGPVATMVYYTAPIGILDYGQALSELSRRYGKASFAHSGRPNWASWCDRRARDDLDCLHYGNLKLFEEQLKITIVAEDPAWKEAQRRALLKPGGKATF